MQKNTQEQHKNLFPSEEVTLPSQGLLYSKDSPLSKGVIQMKYMTAREEDILTNQNLIKKGTVIDKLLQSLIIDDIDYNNLLIGDKNALLVAARILGYGSDYTLKMTNPESGEEELITVDLTEADDKLLDKKLVVEGKNEFDFTLPASKIPITFKLLTHGDEKKIQQEIKGLKKINKQSSADLSTRWKHIITSINGETDKKTIREFVDNKLLARDSRALRNKMGEITPDIDLKYSIEFEDGYIQDNVEIPITVSFFWPDTGV
tara:strand:+ start:297 stop:1082 length:786 start_codon:yes stop_codon:yes gene_type:complete